MMTTIRLVKITDNTTGKTKEKYLNLEQYRTFLQDFTYYNKEKRYSYTTQDILKDTSDEVRSAPESQA